MLLQGTARGKGKGSWGGSVSAVTLPCSDLCLCLPVGLCWLQGPAVFPALPGGRSRAAGAESPAQGPEASGRASCYQPTFQGRVRCYTTTSEVPANDSSSRVRGTDAAPPLLTPSQGPVDACRFHTGPSLCGCWKKRTCPNPPVPVSGPEAPFLVCRPVGRRVPRSQWEL